MDPFLTRIDSMGTRIYYFFTLSVVGCLLATACHAADEFADLKWIRNLPTSEYDIRAAFEASRGEICEAVGPGEPVELSSFASALTNRDRSLKTPPLPSSRIGFMSIGLELTNSNKTDLPVLSRSRIADYLDSNYLLLQARVRRDLLDRELYYHHRPIAVIARYRGTRVSQPLEPLVAQTTKSVRSLGLFLDPDVEKPRKPEQLRTMVLIYRNEMVRPGKSIPEEQYEWVFVRGVENDRDKTLEPHLFVTDENRTRLVHIHQFSLPSRVRACSVIGTIEITQFDRTGLYPESYQTSSYQLNEKEHYSWSNLNEFSQQEHGGPLASHLNQVLDDLIAGKVESQGLRN